MITGCFFLPLGAQEEHATPPADENLPDGSLYALESSWTNQHGNKLEWSLEGKKGKARVLAMGYTYCKGVCPRIIADMQRIQAELNPEELARTTFTFLSFTPENDKVEDLREMVRNHKLDDRYWSVMTGDPDGVLEMAVALGIQYAKLPNKVDYAHSYLVAVLSPDGRVIHKWTNPDEGPEPSVKALRAALDGKPESK